MRVGDKSHLTSPFLLVAGEGDFVLIIELLTSRT